MKINLPDLKAYRNVFIENGVDFPLQIIKPEPDGLLKALPAPPADRTGFPWTTETAPKLYENRTNWPKITIVTPSYNQGKFLEETIRSVLLQNYPNLEYIIMDGGSNDESAAVLKKYEPWISYQQSVKDNGQSHAINMGFSLASGAYLGWINSDDYYLKDTLFKVANTFIQKKADFVYGYAFNYRTEENQFELIRTAPLIDYFLRIPTLVQPSCFWSAGIHQPLWEELHCSLDFELWQRIVKGNKRVLIKAPLSVANIHSAAKTHDAKMDATWARDHQLISSPEAHGAVHNWDNLVFMNRFWKKFHSLFQK